jgi:hypothetical protein
MFCCAVLCCTHAVCEGDEVIPTPCVLCAVCCVLCVVCCVLCAVCCVLCAVSCVMIKATPIPHVRAHIHLPHVIFGWMGTAHCVKGVKEAHLMVIVHSVHCVS